jgi:hypothetical protein
LSANALKQCNIVNAPIYYYVNLQRINKQATQNQMSTYKLAVLLKKYNSNEQTKYWITLNFKQILKCRQLNFKIFSQSNLKNRYQPTVQQIDILK